MTWLVAASSRVRWRLATLINLWRRRTELIYQQLEVANPLFAFWALSTLHERSAHVHTYEYLIFWAFVSPEFPFGNTTLLRGGGIPSTLLRGERAAAVQTVQVVWACGEWPWFRLRRLQRSMFRNVSLIY